MMKVIRLYQKCSASLPGIVIQVLVLLSSFFSGKHCILYELVDESQVEVLNISNPLSQPDVDSFRYPRAGEIFLRLLTFCVGVR